MIQRGFRNCCKFIRTTVLLTERQTLILVISLKKVIRTREISPAVHVCSLWSIVHPVCESAVLYPSRAVGSVRGESRVLTCNPNPTSVYSTVLPRCFLKQNEKKTREKKKNSSGAQRRESSHREFFL